MLSGKSIAPGCGFAGWCAGALPIHAGDVATGFRAAACSMAGLRGQWSAMRPEWDRHSLALARYNAGLGHLLSAQRACGGPSLYPEIIACLPAITGRHSRETITYVDRIWEWYRQMVGGA